MAIINDGGGGKKSTPKLNLGVLGKSPSSAWEEEEERRKRELAKLQSQLRLTRLEKRMNPTWTAPTEQLKKRAAVARERVSQMSDPLTTTGSSRARWAGRTSSPSA